MPGPIPSTHNPAPFAATGPEPSVDNSKADEKLLRRIRERYTYMVKAHKYNRDLGDKDLSALYDEFGPWDPIEVEARRQQMRPCINLPQLNQYPDSLVNQLRANPQGVKVNPAGNGAENKTAELRGNRIRAINAECNAKQAFLTALQCAAERGYGVVTMECEEIEWDGADQRIKVVREPDPNAILWDPDYKEADASDIQDGFKLWRLPREEYKRRWPSAVVQDFKQEEMAIAPDWVGEQTQLVARYSYYESTERYIYWLDDGSPKGLKIFKDELPPGAKAKNGVMTFAEGVNFKILREKKAVEKKVKQCTTNGVEILDKNDWAGKWIPIFPMVGKEVWMKIEGKIQRVTFSYIRQAIHGQKGFNSAATNQVESANMVPKTTYMMYEGQEDTATDWPNINKIPHPFALIKPIVDGATGQVLPHPERIPFDPPTQSMEIVKESCRRAIQAAIGSHGFTILDDTNVKSGKAVNALQAQSDVGSYHFVDGYETTIRHVGRAEDDLLDKIEDTPRDVGLLKEDGTHEMVRINEPYRDKSGQTVEHRYTPRNPETQEPMTDARHDVVIDSGKSYETQQQEASDFVETLIQGPLGPRLTDLAIKWKNLGTFGDQMAERVQPPDTIKQDGMPDLPPPVKQMVGQLQQQNQQLTQSVQQLLAERESKQQDLDSKAQIEQAKIESNERIKALDATLQKLKIENDLKMKQLDVLAKGVIVHEQLSSDENMQLAQMEADRQIAELMHEQEMEAAQFDAQNTSDQMGQEHQQALEQGTAGHEQALEQQGQQNAAAMDQQALANENTVTHRYNPNTGTIEPVQNAAAG